ncbi:N4-gp56 family major capsid protein [Bacillus testis]|uniref:N4-gp56 family major capsid protein n=1 Tax=Bacillus testis TaxID=1622072 RepID=UPI00067F5C0C|nr:N4-gp56 family major capsid protein [Bacillus testis]
MPTKTQTYAQTGAAYNALTAEQAEFYQRALLERLIDQTVFMKYGKKTNIPKRAGATTSFRRMELPALSTTAIVEGTTPDAIDLSITKIAATVKQYGAWTKLSDFLDLTGLDPVLTETAQMFGDHAALSMDVIVRDLLAAGTNVRYANSKTARNQVAAGDKITAADIIKIRTTLVKNNVKQIKLPSGGKGYLAFTHPEVIANIMQMQEWKDQNTYVDTKNREQGIAGQMYGIYFMEATTAPVYAGTGAGTPPIDVYATIVIGEDAYGIPDIQGSSKPEIIVKNSAGDHSDTSNPMNLYSTVAWKSAFTAIRLNENCIVRYESAIN